jgi:hypothetical protein
MASVKFNLTSFLEGIGEVSYDAILGAFKEHHYHRLFVKKVNESGSLVMIHNNLDTAKDNALYKECRSIIYDTGNKCVVSYSHDNVEYQMASSYVEAAGDMIEESYEGTMVGVYNHDGVWYFSSTRCPDINKSFYHNRTKSHGAMFDEALSNAFPESSEVRKCLTDKLDPSRVYYFVLIHHENMYLVDYTPRFGASYAVLMHIITRDRHTQLELAERVVHGKNLMEPIKFDTISMANAFLESTKGSSEGLIIKRNNTDTGKNALIKVPTKEYMLLRYERPNNLNIWINCIEIFQRNNKSYTADTYMTKYTNKKVTDIYGRGKQLDVTGVLFTIIKALSMEILTLHNYFTQYNKADGRYTKLHEEDFKIINDDPVLKVFKVTLSRLQNYQYKFFKDHFSTSDIVDHIRYYTTPEDIMELIKIHDYLRKENSQLFKIMTVNIQNIETVNRFMRTYIFYNDT